MFICPCNHSESYVYAAIQKMLVFQKSNISLKQVDEILLENGVGNGKLPRSSMN